MLCRRKTSKYAQLTNHWFCFDNKGLFEAKCQQNGLPKNDSSEQHAAAGLEIQCLVHLRLFVCLIIRSHYKALLD